MTLLQALRKEQDRREAELMREVRDLTVRHAELEHGQRRMLEDQSKRRQVSISMGILKSYYSTTVVVTIIYIYIFEWMHSKSKAYRYELFFTFSST